MPKPEQLLRLAGKDSRKAISVYQRAIELRETIFRVFSALALGRSPRTADIAALNKPVWEALKRSRISSRDGSYALDWIDKSRPLGISNAWPIAVVGSELLTPSPDRACAECAGDRCDWLFVDASRNHLRRWCSMANAATGLNPGVSGRKRRQRTH